MDDYEALPTDPGERRKIQNRNAQRKYRSRRHQSRIGQAVQSQAQTSSSQLLSWPPTYDGPSDNIWGGSDPSIQGFAPQYEPATSEPQLSQAVFSTTFIPAYESTGNRTNDSDSIYSASESEPTALSNFASLDNHSPSFSNDAAAAFAMPSSSSLDSSVGTTTNTTDAISTRPMLSSLVHGSNPEPPAPILNPNPLSLSAPHVQGAFRHAVNERLNASTRQASSMVLDPAVIPAPTASANPGGTNESSPNTSNNSSDSVNDWLSILHIASHRGHDAIVRILLERDVNIDERDGDGRTALQLAAMNGHTAVVRLLLQRGAHINACDALGRTALHWAALQKHKQVLRIFLDAGADVNIRDSNDWTVLHVAVERGFESGLQLILLHGADLSLKARKCEGWKQSEPPA